MTAAKAIVAAVMAGLTALYTALEGPGAWDVTDREAVAIALALVSAGAVYFVPNKPGPPNAPR